MDQGRGGRSCPSLAGAGGPRATVGVVQRLPPPTIAAVSFSANTVLSSIDNS